MTNKQKLKELWNSHKGLMREEILDEIIIKIYTMFSYDNLDEPPFTLGKELQETLDMDYIEKYSFLDSVLGYKAISK